MRHYHPKSTDTSYLAKKKIHMRKYTFSYIKYIFKKTFVQKCAILIVKNHLNNYHLYGKKKKG